MGRQRHQIMRDNENNEIDVGLLVEAVDTNVKNLCWQIALEIAESDLWNSCVFLERPPTTTASLPFHSAGGAILPQVSSVPAASDSPIFSLLMRAIRRSRRARSFSMATRSSTCLLSTSCFSAGFTCQGKLTLG